MTGEINVVSSSATEWLHHCWFISKLLDALQNKRTLLPDGLTSPVANSYRCSFR